MLLAINNIRKMIKKHDDRSEKKVIASRILLELAQELYMNDDYVVSDTLSRALEKWSSYPIEKYGKKIKNQILESRIDLCNEIIYDKLKEECSNHHDIWYCSIYGSGWDSGLEEGDEYKECYDPYSIEPIEITNKFLELNYCGHRPSLSRNLCDNCRNNFRKVKYFLDRGELHVLASDWNADWNSEDVVLNTVREIRSMSEYKKDLPDIDFDKESENVFIFDSYFNGSLEPHLEAISKKMFLNMGWYFSGDLSPLLKLPNLKGLILGHWFDGDLNVLESHPSLEFIQVRYSFNKEICDKLYKITFR